MGIDSTGALCVLSAQSVLIASALRHRRLPTPIRSGGRLEYASLMLIFIGLLWFLGARPREWHQPATIEAPRKSRVSAAVAARLGTTEGR